MGSNEKGYTISVNTIRHLLNVRAWGIWDVEDMELAKSFKEELRKKVNEVNMNGEEWAAYGDFIELHPHSKEVCRIMGDGIIFAIKHGMKRKTLQLKHVV